MRVCRGHDDVSGAAGAAAACGTAGSARQTDVMRRVLRVFPDYTADPVWDMHGMVDLDTLLISDRLRRDLREWARDWEDQLGPDFRIKERERYEAWRRRGRLLARDLARELALEMDVRYEA